MSWSPTQEDIDRVKMLRQMELSLREQVRRKEIEVEELKRQNSFARYVLQFFDDENTTTNS